MPASYFLDEGPSLETSNFSLYFSGSCIPTNESLLLLAPPTLAQTVQDYVHSPFHFITLNKHAVISIISLGYFFTKCYFDRSMHGYDFGDLK
jgi:hypothetical protein